MRNFTSRHLSPYSPFSYTSTHKERRLWNRVRPLLCCSRVLICAMRSNQTRVSVSVWMRSFTSCSLSPCPPISYTSTHTTRRELPRLWGYRVSSSSHLRMRYTYLENFSWSWSPSMIKLFEIFDLIPTSDHDNYNNLSPTGLTSGYNVLDLNKYVKVMKYKDV